MKKIVILIVILGIALSFSCKKTELEEITTFKGRVLTNGTEDIVLSNNGEMPLVAIYKIDKASFAGSSDSHFTGKFQG